MSCSRGGSGGGPAVLELLEAGLHRVVAVGHVRAVRRLLAHPQDEGLQPGVLLLPATQQFLEAREPFLAGRVVRAESTAVHPYVAVGRSGLHADDLLGGPGEQLPVVGDEEDRLTGLLQLLLQPALAGDVEIVVRLVEQQHLVGPAQQRLQHQPLLLASGQRAHLTPLRLLVRDAEGLHRAHVPDRLGLVPAHLRPVAQCLRVRHLRGLVVGGEDQLLGPVDGVGGLPNPGLGDGDQQVPHRALVAHRADELLHHAEPAAHRNRAAVRLEVPGDQPQQRGLTGAVRPDEGDHGTVRDAERSIAEQHPPVR